MPRKVSAEGEARGMRQALQRVSWRFWAEGVYVWKGEI